MKSPISVFLVSTLLFVFVNSKVKDVHFVQHGQSHISEEDIFNVFMNKTPIVVQNGTNSSDFTTLTFNYQNETTGDNFEAIEDFEVDFEQFLERKHCLDNLTQCIEKDDHFTIATGKITKLLFSTSQTFDLSKVNGISKKCHKQAALYKRELQKFTLWALKMFDSTAKVPSGLLNGNVNQYGDFDQCLSVNNDQNVRGKYCLAYMQVEVRQSPYLAVLHNLIQSHSPFKSRLSDPGHRVPRVSTVNWALCVPDGCSAKDVEIGVKELIAEPLIDLGLHVQVEVNSDMCQSKTSNYNVPLSTIIAGLFFLTFISLPIIATIYDFLSKKHNHEYLMAFSLIKNVKSLLSLQRSEGDIASVHGIRCLNALMLVMAHKAMALYFNPYTNRTQMTELLGRPWSVLARAASLYTDPFIMLSGMLTAYSILGRLKKNQDINICKEYVSRLFRLVPTLGALILFCTFILPMLGSGPQWPLVINHHADICKDTWWRNLLFIHNYFGFKNMCLTHTHHVGIDTQLFAFSPLFIWLIWRWPRQGATLLFSLATISTIMRYYVTYTMKLSNYVHFGTSISQLFATADNMYILPAHRLTVYIMGILLAYLMRTSKKIHLEPALIKAGNAFAVLMFSFAFFGPAFMGSIGYKYNPRDAAWYAAFAPIGWSFSFGWIIYTSHFGYESYISKFFSWKGFLITTRLSYAIYLTQFPVFFYNIGVTRSSEQYTFFRMQLNIPEIMNIVFYSVLLTLLFDTPFQNIKNILFRRSRIIKKIQMEEKKLD